MKAFTLHLSRLYSLTKAALALFGLAAAVAVILLPSERYLIRNTLPALGSAEATPDETTNPAAVATITLRIARDRRTCRPSWRRRRRCPFPLAGIHEVDLANRSSAMP